MIRQACPICESERLEVFHDQVRGGKTLDIVKCEACNTFHLDKDFNQERLNQYYIEDYRKEFTSELNAKDNPEKFFFDKLPLARRRLELSRPYLNGRGKNGSYLEIGCGPGYFLNELKRFSSNLYGIELNMAHARYASQLGIKMCTDPVEKARLDTKFDIIFIFHVLEHIAEPIRYLNLLKGMLNQGGKIILEVPGITDPLILLYRIRNFRNFYFQEPHLYCFSEKSFGVISKKIGMKVEFKSYNQYGMVNHLTWAIRGESNVSKRADGNVVNIAFENERIGKKIFEQLNGIYVALLSKHGFHDTTFVVLSEGK